jgi:hypothetical protein
MCIGVGIDHSVYESIASKNGSEIKMKLEKITNLLQILK